MTSALRDTPRAKWPGLSESTELHTSGSLDRFAKEVEKRLDTDPREALAIAELASAIAETLAPESYPPLVLAQLRAHAWKDRGQALSYLGRYDEALRAFDRAQERLDTIGMLGHDEAVVGFCRAIALQLLRRFDEAQALLNDCRKVFSGYGEEQLYVKCTLAMGNLLVRKGDYRAAREVLTPLVSDSPLIAAKARMALGWCAVHLNDAAVAIEHFDEAARGCRTLGSELEAVRAVYGAGSAMLRLHRFAEAIETLRSTREVFLAHGLIEEGGLSGLGIVEAHLALGQLSAARTLAASIVGEFTVANLNRRAVAALAYLNDVIAASSATPEVVRGVHAYIHTLQTDPTREFIQPN
ncbi:MAG TPA: tetratricopeptide repeat protein [Thermoanaerobaculia bacterium]|nr:tetratricopeptide repeat protein [Thermoanaerobaculia bacterium]